MIRVGFDPENIFSRAEWIPDSNEIWFYGVEDWSCAPDNPDLQYFTDVATHELGHALGLCHDGCSAQGGMTIMRQNLPRGNTYAIKPEHCSTIIEVNSCDGGGENLTGSGPCCFYCELIPQLDNKCERAPVLCAGTIEPPDGSCVYRLTTIVYYGTVEYTYPGGTVTISGDLYSTTRATIECFSLQGEVQSEISTSPAGAGPLVLVRSEFPQGASGLVPISGVARDDTYGVAELHFWVDGQPVTLSGLQTELPDPWICSEVPAAGCNSNSRFTGWLDTRGLSDGPHTLQVVAINGRSADPIPTYHEVAFTVSNGVGCADSTPPTVAVTSPSSGQVISGMTTVTAEATDASGIASVAFYVDGAWKTTDPAAPYAYNWDTTAYGDGPHQVRVLAEDGCGNTRFSTAVDVEIAHTPVISTFAPTDDAWVLQTQPFLSLGDRENLSIRTSTTGQGRHSYLRFAVSGIEGTILSVRLRIRTQYYPILAPTNVYRLATTSWSEATLNWSNAPLDVTWSRALPVPMASGTWYELDLTGSVTGNGVFTFALATNGDEPGSAFWSKDSVHPPVLEITWQR